MHTSQLLTAIGLAISSVSAIKDIPSIGLGTWLSDRDKVASATEFALKNGYNHVDAAWIYRNEDQTGKGLAAASPKRDNIWITSKLWNAHHRPDQAKHSIKETLDNLGVDKLDLYLIHWPVAFLPGNHDGSKLDLSTSITDTWRTMEDLVRANLTRHIGISNFAKRDVKEILDICTICPYAHEYETHPYLQQQDFLEWHQRQGIKVIAYSPLGNTNPTYSGKGKIELPALLKNYFWADLAASKNITPAQAVLAWGVQRGTIVIPKSVHEKYLVENLASLGVKFSKKELEAIAKQDAKTRFNDPGKGWGLKLFADLDDPTDLDGKADEL